MELCYAVHLSGLQRKCEQYWIDQENEEKLYGDIGVTMLDTEVTSDFLIRTFNLRVVCLGKTPCRLIPPWVIFSSYHAHCCTIDNKMFSFQGEENRNVKQFHFTAWPDHGVPTQASPIITFRRKVISYDESHDGTIVIHCRCVDRLFYTKLYIYHPLLCSL